MTNLKAQISATLERHGQSNESATSCADTILRLVADELRTRRVYFPTALRKMWSGNEVQRWLDAGSVAESLLAPELDSAQIADTSPTQQAAQQACSEPPPWLAPAQDVLRKNFGLTLPDTRLAAIIRGEPHLIADCATGRLASSTGRDRLIRAVQREFNLPRWPACGDSNEYICQFTNLLTAVIEEAGGTVQLTE